MQTNVTRTRTAYDNNGERIHSAGGNNKESTLSVICRRSFKIYIYISPEAPKGLNSWKVESFKYKHVLYVPVLDEYHS